MDFVPSRNVAEMLSATAKIVAAGVDMTKVALVVPALEARFTLDLICLLSAFTAF